MNRVRIIAEHKDTHAVPLREAWARLLEGRPGETLYYQSPAYFDHLAERSTGESPVLAVVEDDDAKMIGVVPLRRSRSSLEFVAKEYCLARRSFPAVTILGSNPLLPQSPQIFAALLSRLAAEFPECDAFEIAGLSTCSLLWPFLEQWSRDNREFLLYVPNGVRWCHTVAIPPTFEDYLGALKRKKRYNLKRQARRLEQSCGGDLTLRTVESPEGVCYLQRAVEALAPEVFQAGSEGITAIDLADLARRGLLQSYVLASGGEFYAVAIGTTYQGTLLMHRFAHNRRLDAWSPGAVMQMLIMRQLIEGKRVKRIDYGFGEPKLRLTNALDQRVTAMLFRKRVGNWSRVVAHSSFSRAVKLLKAGIIRAAFAFAACGELARLVAPGLQ